MWLAGTKPDDVREGHGSIGGQMMTYALHATIRKRQNGKRVRVEHTFGWIDQFRRLCVQYECSPIVHTGLVGYEKKINGRD